MYLPGAHARSPNKTLKQKLTHYHLTVKTFLQKSQKNPNESG
jgi:hypothetical protein